MVKPISHIEFAWVTFNRSIVIVGGSTMNNPVTKKMVLLGDIFHFDTQSKVCPGFFGIPLNAFDFQYQVNVERQLPLQHKGDRPGFYDDFSN